MPLLLAAPDKFRGTASARQVAAAVGRSASLLGWSVHEIPLSDGGEGLLDVLDGLGGEWETAEVTGPLGSPTEAAWLRLGDLGIVEMARASGLSLVGGPDGNDPMAATSRGTGELVVAAARSLAGRPAGSSGRSGALVDNGGGHGSVPTLVVGLGGSATTDGGLGALRAVEESGGLSGVDLVGACDVGVDFFAAAGRFARQKGASDQQVHELADRLGRLATIYQRGYGVDVRRVRGAGAAGGLGGAIVVMGGSLRSGYDVVTEALGFRDLLDRSQMVITGEGALDATSFTGKVVGGVLRDASSAGVPVAVLAGRISEGAGAAARELDAMVVSLSERFGDHQAMSDTEHCIGISTRELLGQLGSR